MNRVWIAEGCLPCNACESTCPEVFAIPEVEAVVLGTARLDGTSDHNRTARAALTPEAAALWDQIEEAAEGCPVAIIVIEP